MPPQGQESTVDYPHADAPAQHADDRQPSSGQQHSSRQQQGSGQEQGSSQEQRARDDAEQLPPGSELPTPESSTSAVESGPRTPVEPHTRLVMRNGTQVALHPCCCWPCCRGLSDQAHEPLCSVHLLLFRMSCHAPAAQI